MFLYRTSSNVTDSDEDESDIDEKEDVEDSESLQSPPASSQLVYTPPPITAKIQSGKRCYKGNHLEEKLLEIIEKPETKLDEDEMFCLSISSTLKKIKDPQKKEYANCNSVCTIACMVMDPVINKGINTVCHQE